MHVPVTRARRRGDSIDSTSFLSLGGHPRSFPTCLRGSWPLAFLLLPRRSKEIEIIFLLSIHSIFLNRILKTVWWRSYIYKFLKEEIDFFYILLFRDRVWIIIYNVEIISSQIIISTLCHLYIFHCVQSMYTRNKTEMEYSCNNFDGLIRQCRLRMNHIYIYYIIPRYTFRARYSI